MRQVVQHHNLCGWLMTLIAFQGNDVILRDGKVGTEQACCCQCCQCGTAEEDVFVSSSCNLQSIVITFDFSLLGPCTGIFEVEITAADEDKGFPWSKITTATTAGGTVTIESNLFCISGCIVLQFTIIPGTCDFCSIPGFFQPVSPTVDMVVSGVTNEDGICCPVGGDVTVGPNIANCFNTDTQFSISATFVY